MSIWTRKLWGKEEAGIPAREVTLRCWRLRMHNDHLAMRMQMVNVALMMTIPAIGIAIAEWLRLRDLASALTMAGGPKVPLEIWPVVWLGLGALTPAIAVGAIGCLVPFIQKKQFDARWVLRPQERWRKWSKIRRRIQKIQVRALFCVFGLGVVISILLPEGGREPFMILGSMPLIVGGLGLAIWGFIGRAGRRVVCARCDYPMRSWRDAGEKCTECGNAWKAPWGAAVGQRVVQWKYVCGGLAVLGVGIGAMVLPFWEK